MEIGWGWGMFNQELIHLDSVDFTTKAKHLSFPLRSPKPFELPYSGSYKCDIGNLIWFRMHLELSTHKKEVKYWVKNLLIICGWEWKFSIKKMVCHLVIKLIFHYFWACLSQNKLPRYFLGENKLKSRIVCQSDYAQENAYSMNFKILLSKCITGKLLQCNNI